MTMIKVSAFRWVPPFAQGLVRDLRVRWALEEAGLPYEERLIGPADQKSDGYRALQPFGQVPSYEENGLELFESGAIVLHIAERAESLMPPEPVARARTKTWMFAALNTVEPPIVFLNAVSGTPDAEESPLKQGVVGLVEQRLDSLCSQLSGRDYLEHRFTAADLLMTSVLRILRTTTMVTDRPVLEFYRLRCEDRPAFKKALDAQMSRFAENAPPG
jgi:glutathione S-transferase